MSLLLYVVNHQCGYDVNDYDEVGIDGDDDDDDNNDGVDNDDDNDGVDDDDDDNDDDDDDRSKACRGIHMRHGC
jgi:hypothetical protein